MQTKTKVLSSFAFALFGATWLGFFAVTGWNHWTSPSTFWTGVSYLVSAYAGASWGYLYTRNRSAGIKISAIIGGALLTLLCPYSVDIRGWTCGAPSPSSGTQRSSGF